MATLIEQDGFPYLPEPNDRQYREITREDVLRDYLGALVQALRDYFNLQKTDADRLASPGLAGTKVYYVADSSGGAVTRKLTFIDGILISET
jgi:hypothetical protein